MKILVTGGCGFIGSHTVCELLNNNYEVVIVDNLWNSSRDVIAKIEKITNKKVKFYESNVCDRESLTKIFEENKIDSVIHFAGLKAVGESVSIPIKYYHNNLLSTLNLIEVMGKFNCKKLPFHQVLQFMVPLKLYLLKKILFYLQLIPMGTPNYF